MEFTLEKLEELATIKVWELALNGHKEAIKLIEQYEISNPNKQINMAQPTINSKRDRESQSTVTNTTVVRVNGIPTKEVVTTITVDDELIYTATGWKQQETENTVTNNL